jgi:predicted nucleotidyltransferase
MTTCEGDLLETFAGSIFDVKGLIHPPNSIIAFIRYFPTTEGERERNGTVYGKVYSLSERYELLKKRFPQYLVYDQVFDETLCEVPVGDVKKLYKPIEKLQELRGIRELDPLECKALEFVEFLKEETNIPWQSIGISGSIMVRLHRANSDIDAIVYGSQNCRKVYSTLERMLKSGHASVKPYTLEDLTSLFDFRSKDSSANFESFVRTESRKVMQGKFLGTDYFFRFVKSWDEIDECYGDVQYQNMGVAEVRGTVADDSEAIFTPCVYKVDGTRILDGPQVGRIEEIVSFRGRFCEQAIVGEAVIARGKLERVIDKRRALEYFRLLLGNKPSDFMILA